MSVKRAKIRLFVEQDLAPLQSVPLDRDHAHYLFNVMRLVVGDRVALFNGRDGEWTAEIVDAQKKRGIARCLEQARIQRNPPDLWLLFAPIKKTRTDFIVEKAAELGAARICPVQSDFTNAERIRQDRLLAHAVEAAEQCGGTFVPEVTDLQKLSDMLANWPEDRDLFFCDEELAEDATAGRPNKARQKAAILIGPEGGFSDAERRLISALPAVKPMSLGPRILRADTAAVAALTLWQARFGDWQ